ncbi:hypothetical protein [Alteromonas sp. KUL49]|uniref:hypothetical protein n=1 Tax=Alteromonas sp. KUL49 TaxID=2480798 RepID=UPI00102EF657|nr:hypothetical protein [Alteromonas sp. KUL49]TAP40927.1 hypothetical protein EYS00_07415 [Alteromonas sp. KUL49]GEA11108.1 hypothetical protein KUL49_14830 [Alteromonas sp. KUL49]
MIKKLTIKSSIAATFALVKRSIVSPALLAFTMLFSSDSIAACFPEFVDYSLEAEVKRSSAILIATPVKREWVNDVDEPDFYSGSIYELQIHQTLFSTVHTNVELWDPNNSGRFAPDIGKKYLLILYQNSDGKFAADYCGNSGLLDEREEIVSKLKEVLDTL